jgi:hypothetical protein
LDIQRVEDWPHIHRTTKARGTWPDPGAGAGARLLPASAAPKFGPITLTDHVFSYEFVSGTDWHQVVAIDLATGNVAWKTDLGSAPITDGGMHNSGSAGVRPLLWVTQLGNPRTFDAAAAGAVAKISGEVPTLKATGGETNSDALVKMCIDTNGKVTSVKVVTSAGTLQQVRASPTFAETSCFPTRTEPRRKRALAGDVRVRIEQRIDDLGPQMRHADVVHIRDSQTNSGRCDVLNDRLILAAQISRRLGHAIDEIGIEVRHGLGP